MPYLIDGHNLIPKIPGIHLHEVEDEIKLISLLQDYCRKTSTKVEIYFDNAPPGSIRKQKYSRVTAHFVHQGWTADDAIRLRLKKMNRAAKNWTVITSDREIIVAAREAGAKVLSAEIFAYQILSDDEKQGESPETDANLNLSPKAIDEWLKIFGLRDDEP